MKDCYFIVLDEAPIKGHPTPKYVLCFGNPDTTIGTHKAEHRTIKELVRKAGKGEEVWRVYMNRTDGYTGKKLLQSATAA